MSTRRERSPGPPNWLWGEEMSDRSGPKVNFSGGPSDKRTSVNTRVPPINTSPVQPPRDESHGRSSSRPSGSARDPLGNPSPNHSKPPVKESHRWGNSPRSEAPRGSSANTSSVSGPSMDRHRRKNDMPPNSYNSAFPVRTRTPVGRSSRRSNDLKSEVSNDLLGNPFPPLPERPRGRSSSRPSGSARDPLGNPLPNRQRSWERLRRQNENSLDYSKGNLHPDLSKSPIQHFRRRSDGHERYVAQDPQRYPDPVHRGTPVEERRGRTDGSDRRFYIHGNISFDLQESGRGKSPALNMNVNPASPQTGRPVEENQRSGSRKRSVAQDRIYSDHSGPPGQRSHRRDDGPDDESTVDWNRDHLPSLNKPTVKEPRRQRSHERIVAQEPHRDRRTTRRSRNENPSRNRYRENGGRNRWYKLIDIWQIEFGDKRSRKKDKAREESGRARDRSLRRRDSVESSTRRRSGERSSSRRYAHEEWSSRSGEGRSRRHSGEGSSRRHSGEGSSRRRSGEGSSRRRSGDRSSSRRRGYDGSSPGDQYYRPSSRRYSD